MNKEDQLSTISYFLDMYVELLGWPNLKPTQKAKSCTQFTIWLICTRALL